jgi:phage-related holin
MSMQEIINKLNQVFNYLFVKGGIILTTILTLFLTAIGFPKSVIYFILSLIIFDILTRWFSIVYKKYGKFNLANFYKAWKERSLNSKKLKIGFFTKVFFYAILLIIAHQASIVPELAFGEVISNFMYSMIIILDMISILENMIESGWSKLKGMLAFFNKKKDELVGGNESETEAEEIQIPTEITTEDTIIENEIPQG